MVMASILLGAAGKPSDKERISALEAQVLIQTAQNAEYNRVIRILILRTDDLNARVEHFENQDINEHENNEKAVYKHSVR